MFVPLRDGGLNECSFRDGGLNECSFHRGMVD